MPQIIHRNRRRDHRRNLPSLEMTLCGIEGYVCCDWSLGGFSASGPADSFSVGDPLTGGLRPPGGDGDWLQFDGTVTRTLPQLGLVAARFNSLSPECYAFLERQFRRPTQGPLPEIPHRRTRPR